MKLINRDKFIGDMFDFYIENGWSPRDIHFSLLDVQSNIDSPEFEVKAIPVEFIKKLIEEFDCERGNAIKDTFAHILTGLLEFWEFEQEKEKETSARPTVSLVSGSVKFSDNVTITQINNDIGHGNVTAISSVKPDPNLKLVGNKEE